MKIIETASKRAFRLQGLGQIKLAA